MPRLKLPIGIQSFQSIRTEGYAYVDKTPFVGRLADQGKYYFLSRPRRFGKSLFVDTLDCAFSGRKELFQGLYLEKHWDWSRKHPVLRIDWSISPARSQEDLRARIREMLAEWERRWGVETRAETSGGRLHELVRAVAEREGTPVVVLVDEYDKPILDNLREPELASALRDQLKDFYGGLKPLDPYLRFVFLTGVSKFSKTGIFSGLNNLRDITVSRELSPICGYTEGELGSVFAEWLADFDRRRVREWYNGYSWTGEPVYNPFDILFLFAEGQFRAWWFETGTPTFLVELWERRPRAPMDYDGMVANDDLLGSFQIEDLRTEALLFQAGYLTIKDWSSDPEVGTRYVLGYPNREVRQSLNQLLLRSMSGGAEDIAERGDRLRRAMEAGDTAGLREIVHSFFASIPHDWYRNNPIRRFEGYYASVFYSYFAGLGYEVLPEDATNKGRVDLTVKARSAIWIFELKVKGADRAGEARPLEQLLARGYAEKYRADGRPIRQVGVLFDPEERNIDGWETVG